MRNACDGEFQISSRRWVTKCTDSGEPKSSSKPPGPGRGLLLLLFLLHPHFTIASGQKGVENIGVEQRFADGVELELGLVEIIMQAIFKNLLDGAELKFGHEPPGQLLAVIRETSFRHAGNM